MEKRGYLTKNDLIILKQLVAKDCYVMELRDKIKIPHKTIKERLKHLKDFGIISYRTSGKSKENFIIKNKKLFVEQVLKIFKIF